jgi:hypothetical protein
VRDFPSLDNADYPRKREIRDLEILLLEARYKQLHDLVRSPQLDECQRENINELMEKLAQMKAVGSYLRWPFRRASQSGSSADRTATQPAVIRSAGTSSAPPTSKSEKRRLWSR